MGLWTSSFLFSLVTFPVSESVDFVDGYILAVNLFSVPFSSSFADDIFNFIY